MLSSISLPSPAVSTLQKSANQFGPAIEEMNENDISEKGCIKKTLQLHGLSKDSPIFAEYDRQYHTCLLNAKSKTPFVRASQYRDVIVENVTIDKFNFDYNHSNNPLKEKCLTTDADGKACKGFTDCLAKCYIGNHSHCPKHSFVCKRGRKYTFPFMPNATKRSLLISHTDSTQLQY
ncbi:uncharacterized protein [Apostichopus japonicus]|uniref:uncharacterized protein n=1 Tax=Stichopus japonicus TaxID=307972 RepID=UPI003AB196C4